MLFAYVIWTIFYQDSNIDHLKTAFAMALFLSLITLVDYHWSSVVRFFAKHSLYNKRKIKWLESDSEPSHAYYRDGLFIYKT